MSCSSPSSQKGALFIHLKGAWRSAAVSLADSVRLHLQLHDLCTPLSTSPFCLLWPTFLSFSWCISISRARVSSLLHTNLLHIRHKKAFVMLEMSSKCCVPLKCNIMCVCVCVCTAAAWTSSHRLECEEASSSR